MEQSKLTELVFELFGVKAATEIVRDLMKEASSEAKQKFADAVLARYAMPDKSFEIQNAVDAAVREIAEEVLERQLGPKTGEIEEKVRAMVAARIDDTVRHTVDRALNELKRKILSNAIYKG